ncbi:MAG TPA: hypothetical protein DEO84_02515 [candidate division Zixibacteria bacterium]|nr:hypothetical protein [candidate division Zixibacteria bacterium]HBZ00171.1 hypothetical protein [candidate division Zixibacteria bacterium]
MRAAILVTTLFLFPAMLMGAEAGRRIVLDEASLGVASLEKTLSTTAQTGFSFHLAGVELSDRTVSISLFQEVRAITDSPEKFGETGEEGLPNLPVYAQLVAIPDQAGVTVQILSSSFQIVDNVDVYPTQPPSLVGQSDSDIPFSKNEAFYQRDEFYPSSLVALGEPIILRDLRLIQAVVNPVQYNPVTRQLKVYTNVDYSLVYEGTDSRNQKVGRSNNISESFLPIYREVAPNVDEMLASYQPIKGGYLILAPHTIPDSLIQLLARWKHLKGYSVVVTKDTDINPGGNPSATQIFNYIQNAYNTWSIPPEYVCILGDVGDGIVDYSYDGHASDYKYSCVDGTDYLADLMVTRMSMPISNFVIRTTIYKDLIYEKTPFMGDPAYWSRGLCAAANLSGSGGATPLSPRLNALWTREQLLRHGYSSVDTSFAWDNYNPGPTQVMNAINNGVSIVTYRGGGFTYGFQGIEDFRLEQLDQLSGNNKMGIMAPLTCGMGDFAGESFGEKWIQMGSLPNSLKGGPGFYGASRHDSHTKYDNPIMIGFISAFLEQGITNFSNAAYAGKLELYNSFPSLTGPGDWVEQYFQTFITLGEPEFDIRTAAPQTMTVTYPSTLPVGSSQLNVHVTGTGGLPLVNAYVNLVKGRSTEEVFVGGRTDSNGDITLAFSTIIADTMFVTVTSHNYIPHIGFALVQAQPVAVNINTIALDDDNQGNSHGNSDGNANPSETVEFSISLRNFGNATTATNVSATLSSPSPDIFITVPTQFYAAIAPGLTATAGEYAALLAPSIANDEHYILSLTISCDQGSWRASVPLDVKNMSFRETGLSYPGNSNNRLDPGETSALVVSLQNIGALAGTSISGVLTTSDTAIVILNGTANFGTIAIGGTGSNSGSPFSVQARSGTFQGRNVTFNLALTSANGSVAQRPFQLTVGTVNTFDPIGPDSYGYYLYDNTDIAYAACPVYNWLDISTIGTRVNFQYGTDDDAIIDSLPFSMRYYGQTFNKALVCTNGFIAFDTLAYDMQGHRWATFDNGQIPEPGAPDGIIAPFWDDLEYTLPNGVFRYFDSASHYLVYEWKGMVHARSGSSETFEMIIYDPAYYPTPTTDCQIVFQYNYVTNDDYDGWNFGASPGAFSTVGMQNLSNRDGLEYTYDDLYPPGAAILQSGRAVKITTATGLQAPPNISFSPTSFIKSADAGQVVHDTLNIANLNGGLLSFTILEFTDNDRFLKNGVNENVLIVQSIPSPIKFVTNVGAKAGNETEPLYPPMTLTHGGPDTFGNSWLDSDEPGGPAYNWVDISGIGTPVTIVGNDDYVGPIGIGFNFPFYGASYSSLYINANGILSFGEGTSAWNNSHIPNTTIPNNIIAPYWDDLSPNIGGTVMYYFDAVNNRFIVSFTNTKLYTPDNGTGNLNFEAILYADGRILYEYGSLDGGTVGLYSCTVGIENSSGSDGLQVVYNGAYLHNNMAVLFNAPTHWLSCDINSGSLVAGADTSAVITFDATNLAGGTYTGHLGLESNDPDQGSISIPVSFTVDAIGVPQIVQTPASFIDTLQTGQISSFDIKAKNTGNSVLTLAFNASNVWLTTLPGPYNISPGDSIFHAVTINSAGFEQGIYNSSIITTTNDQAHLQITLPVQLLVPAPVISFHPVAFTDTVNDDAQIIHDLVIVNNGGSNLYVTLTAVEGNLLVRPKGNTLLPGISSNGNNGAALEILNNWLFVSPAIDSLAPADSLIASISLNATIEPPGSYIGRIIIDSNDPASPTSSVPVSLVIQAITPNCSYVVGDVNNNHIFSGLDVTYSVRYFKGGPAPFYSCECPPGSGHSWYVAGDVNGSCTFSGLDVTYMVGYFKGRAAPFPCPDCPPSLFSIPSPGPNPIKAPMPGPNIDGTNNK